MSSEYENFGLLGLRGGGHDSANSHGSGGSGSGSGSGDSRSSGRRSRRTGAASSQQQMGDNAAGSARQLWGNGDMHGSHRSGSSGGSGGGSGSRASRRFRSSVLGVGGGDDDHGEDWDAANSDDDDEAPPPVGEIYGNGGGHGSGSVHHRSTLPSRGAIESARQFLWEDDSPSLTLNVSPRGSIAGGSLGGSMRGSIRGSLGGGGGGNNNKNDPFADPPLAENGSAPHSSSGSILTTRNIDWGGGAGGKGSSATEPLVDEPLPDATTTVATVFGSSSAASSGRLVMPARGMSFTGADDEKEEDHRRHSRFPRPDEIEASKKGGWNLRKALENIAPGVDNKVKKNRKSKKKKKSTLPDMANGDQHDQFNMSLNSITFEESLAMNLAPPRAEDDGASLAERRRRKGRVGRTCVSVVETFVHERKRCLLFVALAAFATGTIVVMTSKGGADAGASGSSISSAASPQGPISPGLGEAGTSPGDTTSGGAAADASADRIASIKSRIIGSGYTSSEMLDSDSTTAQSKALQWISELDGAKMDPDDDMLLQRYGLAVFFFSTYVSDGNGNDGGGEVAGAADTDGGTGGETPVLGDVGSVRGVGAAEKPEMVPGEEVWIEAAHWMSAQGYCSWYGIQCHHREGTDVEDTMYDGNNGVTHLNLTSNGVRGAIPSEIAALSDLRVVDLMENSLTGTLPSSLGNLKHTISLSLSDNDLTGTIPPELGELTSMSHLYLDRNMLEGSVPSELGDAVSMHVLGLYENYLTGQFPPLQKMKNLRSLYLDDNQLSGPIPGEILGELTAMEDLRLGTNNFTGPIPSQIGNLEKLSVAYLEYNALSGVIPWEVYELKGLDELHLHENYLTGTIPYQFGELRDLEVLYLDHNKLTGTIPAPLGDMDDMMELYLQGNQLSGTIPPLLTRLEDLVDLRLDFNSLSGTIPDNIQRLFKLEWLHLNDNSFTGAPPRGLANLQRLRGLRLNGNELKGEIPEGVCQLKGSGDLKLLQADCAGEEPAVVCDCCTECF